MFAMKVFEENWPVSSIKDTAVDTVHRFMQSHLTIGLPLKRNLNGVSLVGR